MTAHFHNGKASIASVRSLTFDTCTTHKLGKSCTAHQIQHNVMIAFSIKVGPDDHDREWRWDLDIDPNLAFSYFMPEIITVPLILRVNPKIGHWNSHAIATSVKSTNFALVVVLFESTSTRLSIRYVKAARATCTYAWTRFIQCAATHGHGQISWPITTFHFHR